MDEHIAELLTRLGRIEGSVGEIRSTVGRIEQKQDSLVDDQNSQGKQIVQMQEQIGRLKLFGVPAAALGGLLGSFIKQWTGIQVP